MAHSRLVDRVTPFCAVTDGLDSGRTGHHSGKRRSGALRARLFSRTSGSATRFGGIATGAFALIGASVLARFRSLDLALSTALESH